ncbi:hypothetical protein EA472_20240 [Natrarchaeobius oligotrophus]|uniref:Uncharacterized protein n=1 Tax=Natrarchaeobius chitinivorans TaxID=1679083 RepID=A0A3N6MIJ5_NATCH|nr:hypothetical protein EA472_20240 [Natrarchaeobius chitinivorans]
MTSAAPGSNSTGWAVDVTSTPGVSESERASSTKPETLAGWKTNSGPLAPGSNRKRHHAESDRDPSS